MKTILMILSLLFFLNCTSQEVNFENYLKKNTVKIGTSFLDKIDAESTEKVSKFDFLNIKPIKGEINENDFYNVYYNNSKEIIKVERISKLSNYSNYTVFFLTEYNLDTKMVLKMNNQESLSDIIIFNYQKKELFAIKGSKLLNDELKVGKSIDINSINLVYLLNPDFSVKNKLNFHNGDLVSFSRIKESKDTRFEKMLVYKNHLESDNLKLISFKKLITFLNIGKKYDYDNIISLTAEPFQKKYVPLFLISDNYN